MKYKVDTKLHIEEKDARPFSWSQDAVKYLATKIAETLEFVGDSFIGMNSLSPRVMNQRGFDWINSAITIAVESDSTERVINTVSLYSKGEDLFKHPIVRWNVRYDNRPYIIDLTTDYTRAVSITKWQKLAHKLFGKIIVPKYYAVITYSLRIWVAAGAYVELKIYTSSIESGSFNSPACDLVGIPRSVRYDYIKRYKKEDYESRKRFFGDKS